MSDLIKIIIMITIILLCYLTIKWNVPLVKVGENIEYYDSLGKINDAISGLDTIELPKEENEQTRAE